MSTLKKRYIDWRQLEGYCNEIIRQLNKDAWRPDYIVGITRGGAVPAIMLSQYLDIKMVGMDVSLRDYGEFDMGPESNCWAAEDAANGKKILIVDDINDTGATFNWIVKDWDITGTRIKWGENVRFAVIIDNESSKATHSPQYCGESINKAVDDVWQVFPWEDWWKPNV
jgi:hypoxanthine phosphoribosyltransferase